jgi:ferric-dicitrate binding protein FerR (iron transport regulator)
MEENYYQLIIAYFDKTISDDGLTQLHDWTEESAENLAQFSETIQILEASRASLKTPGRTAQSWAKIQAHVAIDSETKKISSKKWKWLSVAAAFLVIGTGGWFSYNAFNTRQQPEYVTIINVDGKHSKIVLPDNSTVILSGGSTLKYAKNFDGDSRELILDGEAFFDVMHKVNKPFVVKTGKISTVVLGTSFNIKAYHGDNKVAVTVLTGKVGLLANITGRPQLVKYLVKNEQININTQNGLYTSNTTNAAAVAAWTANNFSFYNMPFKDIAASLQHHYGVKIDFTDSDLGNVRLTAKLNNMALMQAMDNLCTLSGLAYTRTNKQFFISHNYQKGGSIMK